MTACKIMVMILHKNLAGETAIACNSYPCNNNYSFELQTTSQIRVSQNVEELLRSVFRIKAG